MLRKFAGLIVIAVAVGLFVNALEGRAPSEMKCNEPGAFAASKEIVRRHLVAPATANFPDIDDEAVAIRPREDCEFAVSGYVDAQNGFGAMLRKQYRVTVRYQRADASWRASNVAIR